MSSSREQVFRIEDSEFERAWNRIFQKDTVPLPAIPRQTSSYPVQLKSVVRDSIKQLREELGKTWIPNRHFGTRLHAIVAARIQRNHQPSGWWITAEKPPIDVPESAVSGA